MASFNVSADDASPLISYGPAGAWTDSPNDPSAPFYSRQSRHTSSSYGASATIHFNGTGIWFFGANMPTYGPYNISIDGQSVAGNAHSQNASYQQLLGGQSGLTNGPHTAVLTNTGANTPIDLDSIIFETQIGSVNSTITAMTVDANSPAIAYLPTPADWGVLRGQGLFNDSLHYTQTGGAQVQFAFDADAVAIFGIVSSDQANYTVTMDGVTKSFQGGSNGRASHLHFGTLLYFADSLTSGPHNVTLTANPARYGQVNTGEFLGIDRIVVLSTSNGSTTADNSGNIAQPGTEGAFRNLPNAVQGSTGAHYTKRLNLAVIGGTIAGTLFLVLLVLAVALFRRRGGGQRVRWRPKLSIRQPQTPNLPMHFCPPRGMSPRSPELNPFSDPSDLEKGVGHTPTGPQEGNPFASEAREKRPSMPDSEMSEARDGNDDCRDKRPTAPIRPARPPSLEPLDVYALPMGWDVCP